MFIVSLEYIAPLEKVDLHAPAHMEWVQKYYQSGLFLASGRKVPRTGGVILARGSRETLEACLKEDPFAIHEIARYEITEFAPSRAVPGLEMLME